MIGNERSDNIFRNHFCDLSICFFKKELFHSKQPKISCKTQILPVLGLPDVLGAVNGNGSSDNPGKMYNNGNANQIYRVVGGRKHVQKSEAGTGLAGMQTESNNTASTASAASGGGSNSIKQPVQEHYDWKQVQIRVRWVVKFLTRGYKISSIL